MDGFEGESRRVPVRKVCVVSHTLNLGTVYCGGIVHSMPNCGPHHLDAGPSEPGETGERMWSDSRERAVIREREQELSLIHI